MALASGGAGGGDRRRASAWETRCETPPGAASEQCAIVQSVVDDQRPNITLVVIALKTADHKSRLLRVIAPLGVLLPTGLDLKLDAEDVGRMRFVRCLPNGCVAETLIDDKLLQRMESAQTMTLRPVSDAGGRHRRAGAAWRASRTRSSNCPKIERRAATRPRQEARFSDPERDSMKSIALPRALPLALALSAAGLLGACSTLDNFMPGAHSVRDTAPVHNADAATPDSEKAVALPLTAEELQCPPVEIDEGGAAARVGGPDNATVRYQFAISQTARECAPVSANQFTLKVGVSGRLLIGPAGKPGTYSAPLRVTVHDENDEEGRLHQGLQGRGERAGRRRRAVRSRHRTDRPADDPHRARRRLHADRRLRQRQGGGPGAEAEEAAPEAEEDRRAELTKRGASGFLPESVEDTQRKSPEAFSLPAPKAQPPRKRSGQWTVG